MSKELFGLLFVGEFIGTEPVKYGDTHAKAGQVVSGLYRLNVAIGEAWDGTPMVRGLTYNATDRDSGDATPAQQSLADLQPNELVACRVKPKNGRGDWGADLELVTVIPIREPLTRVLAE